MTINSDYQTVTITKTPDSDSKEGFTLYVYVVDKNGDLTTATLWIPISAKLNDTVSYSAIEHEITAYDGYSSSTTDTNFFSISLDALKNALSADDLALWNTKISSFSVSYTDSDDNSVTVSSIDVYPATKVGSNISDTSTTGIQSSITSSTNYLVFDVTNTGNNDLVIGETYTATVTFYDSNSEELNSLTFDFVLTLPDIEDIFSLKDSGNKIGDYYYMYLRADDGASDKTVKLSRIFNVASDGSTPIADTSGGFTITLDQSSDSYISSYVSVDATSPGANAAGSTSATITDSGIAYITLYNETASSKVYYGEPITLTISGAYQGWTYPDDEYLTFSIVILSAIGEGTLTSSTGTTSVTLYPSSGGNYVLDNDDIIGYTYNKLASYNVFPDVAGSNTSGSGTNYWSQGTIEEVLVSSANINELTVDNTASGYTNGSYPYSAYYDSDGNLVEGYVTLTAGSTAAGTTSGVNITVTDMWGYSVTTQISVTLEVE